MIALSLGVSGESHPAAEATLTKLTDSCLSNVAVKMYGLVAYDFFGGVSALHIAVHVQAPSTACTRPLTLIVKASGGANGAPLAGRSILYAVRFVTSCDLPFEYLAVTVNC